MNQPKWIQFPRLPDQFPLSTDSVLLADFAAISGRSQVMDLGAGCGTLGLMLAASNPNCTCTGMELQEASVRQAEAVIRLNGMDDRVSVLQGDIREIESLYKSGSFDAVLSNPPYFPVGHGAVAASDALAIARTELCCTLSDLCKAAAWLLRWGSPFYLVHRSERLCDLICELRSHRLEPKRLRFVRHRPNSAPSLVLIESRLGGKSGLNLQQDLILQYEDGTYTEEYRRIYGLEGR